MDLRTFDDPKAKAARAPRTDHTTWAKALIKSQGPDNAYRIVRRLAVPFFIYKKESTVNPQAGFYQAALSYLKKHFPYQGKHGASAVDSKPSKKAQV